MALKPCRLTVIYIAGHWRVGNAWFRCCANKKLSNVDCIQYDALIVYFYKCIVYGALYGQFRSPD